MESLFQFSTFLANVNSRSRLLYAVARPSVVCRKRSYTLNTFKFSPIFRRHYVPWRSVELCRKFHGDCPRGTPPPGELNTRAVAKYSDFGPIDGYISKTVQDRR